MFSTTSFQVSAHDGAKSKTIFCYLYSEQKQTHLKSLAMTH